MTFNLGTYKTTNSRNEVRCNCPFCVEKGKTQDTKFHCYISLTLKCFHCFRCGASGPLSQLKNIEKISFIPRERKRKKKEKRKYIDLIESEIGMKYWKNRGMTRREAKIFNMKYNSKYLMVAFPIMDLDGITKFYVERSIFNIEKSHYIEEGTKKSKYLFNLYQAKNYETICIVEGPMDAVSIGKDAVALMGKMISTTQVNLLRDVKPKKVIIVLDPDAQREQRKIYYELMNYFNVRSINLKTGDVNEIRKEKNKKYLRQKIFNS